LRRRHWAFIVTGALWASLDSVRLAEAAEQTLRIVGADRMVPVVRALASRFGETRPGLNVDVGGGGSDAGVPALVNDAAAIAMLARPVTDTEIRYAHTALNKHLVGIPVAVDGVAVIVAPGNPMESLSLEQLTAIFSAKVESWDDVGVPRGGMGRARGDLHADTTHPIRRHLPERDSGSIHIIERMALRGKRLAQSTLIYPDARSLAQAVAADPLGIGFGGLASVKGVKVLAVQRDADTLAVAPSPATVRDRTYPLAHYLYLYFAGPPTGEAKEFLTFVLSPQGQQIVGRLDSGVAALPLSAGPAQDPSRGNDAGP